MPNAAARMATRGRDAGRYQRVTVPSRRFSIGSSMSITLPACDPATCATNSRRLTVTALLT